MNRVKKPAWMLIIVSVFGLVTSQISGNRDELEVFRTLHSECGSSISVEHLIEFDPVQTTYAITGIEVMTSDIACESRQAQITLGDINQNQITTIVDLDDSNPVVSILETPMPVDQLVTTSIVITD